MKNLLGSFLSLLLFLGTTQMFAQISPDCANAIPICTNTPLNGGTNGFGIDDFAGAAESGCLEKTLSGSIESNSTWYRFKTGATGQLGFNIGFDSNEDWDFALYRANGCDTLGDPVRCNFFDNRQDPKTFTGVGVDPTGSIENFQYEEWLEVTPGEEYYLLINNFSDTNSGFSIQFSGNIFLTDPDTALDCSIIDNFLGPPISACEGDEVVLDATMADAVEYRWLRDDGSGFVEIPGENGATLTTTTSANYEVRVTNLLLNTIISAVQVVFSEIPTTYEMTNAASCTGFDTFNLQQKDAEALGPQDPNNFVVSYYRSLADANSGINVLSKEHETITSVQTIYVRVSSLNNPDCFDVSERFDLISVGTPELSFSSEGYLCEDGTSTYIGAKVAPLTYEFSWDSGQTTPGFEVNEPGEYTVTVTNTLNGLSCINTKTVTVIESKSPQILDVQIEDLQDSNTISIIANTDSEWMYQLDGGDLQASNKFYNLTPGSHTVTVFDPRGCGSVSEQIVVVGFSKFFTPNADGNADQWQIDGISSLKNPKVYIYDRYGTLVKFLDENETLGWDGSFEGIEMPASDYWFRLTYIDDNGQEQLAKYINNHFALKR